MSEKKIRRIISVFLVLAMVFSIFAGMDIVPLNAGDKDNSGSIANCRIEYTDDKVDDSTCKYKYWVDESNNIQHTD